jgi:hypothetical protein
MKRFKLVWLLTVAALGVAMIPGRGQTSETPSFQEVYTVVRSNFTRLSEAELNRAAVVGLLGELKGQAILVTNETNTAVSEPSASLVSKAKVFDEVYGYIRIVQVAAGLGREFDSAYDQLQSTNKLKGLMIDLRFATGHDYSEVGGVASRFGETEQPLFKLRDLTIRSTGRANPITLPVAVLVNQETAGSAEVLAAVLRQINAGLLIGGSTAGQAHPFRNFQLSGGQTLKIASGTIELANGTELTDQGVVPDIRMNVSTADEKAYFEDPYWSAARMPGQAGGRPGPNMVNMGVPRNRSGRRPLNEAELVKMQREGLDLGRDAVPSASEPLKPNVQDPTLGRALDFLKGMAVAQGRR